LIKKTASQPTKTRVLEFKAKHADLEDDEKFEDFLRWTIKKEIPDLHTSNNLTQRVVDAALFRRWKMFYKERHAQKLAQNLENLFDSGQDDQSAEEHGDIIQEGIPIITVEGPKNVGTSPLRSKTTRKMVAFSDTEPSVARGLKVAMAATSKAPSVMSRTGMARRSRLAIPRAPQPSTKESQETVCPYCSNIIGPELFEDKAAAHHRWR
jgi:hypothetical protein